MSFYVNLISYSFSVSSCATNRVFMISFQNGNVDPPRSPWILDNVGDICVVLSRGEMSMYPRQANHRLPVQRADSDPQNHAK